MLSDDAQANAFKEFYLGAGLAADYQLLFENTSLWGTPAETQL